MLALGAAVERRERAFVPDNFQRFARALCGPETVRDHCDAAFDFNHVLHAGNRFRFVGIEILQPAAEHRRTRDDRDEHFRDVHIQAEQRFAIRLVRCVEALGGFPDELERLRVLQGRILRRCEARGFLGQFAIAQPPSRVAVDDLIVFRATGFDADIPCLRGGRKQHLARRGTSLAEPLPFGPGAGAAAGHLNAEDRVIVFRRDRRGFVAHLAPIGIQLLRNHHRHARVRPLTHFRMVNYDGDDVVLADPNEGVQRK